MTMYFKHTYKFCMEHMFYFSTLWWFWNYRILEKCFRYKCGYIV